MVFVIVSCIIFKMLESVVVRVIIVISIIRDVDSDFFVIKLMIVCMLSGRFRVISLVKIV